jgi:hypothetical protein
VRDPTSLYIPAFIPDVLPFLPAAPPMLPCSGGVSPIQAGSNRRERFARDRLQDCCFQGVQVARL